MLYNSQKLWVVYKFVQNQNEHITKEQRWQSMQQGKERKVKHPYQTSWANIHVFGAL